MVAPNPVDWISPIGGNWAYFAKNLKMIGEFIQLNKISAVQITAVAARAGEAPKAGLEHDAAAAFIDLGIRGGIRVPHLHYDNRIYMLSQKQWADFSQKVVADCKARLDKVGQIGFEDAVVLGTVVQGLART